MDDQMDLVIEPSAVSVPKMHGYMLGAVAPRPIAFASTIDKKGNVNLSPFSFFNAFSANPPILVFSPARRVRDNSTKHSLENIHEVQEVVINIVTYSLVQQMSLSSADFPKGVNEFTKSGLTMEPALHVKPPRVKESPAAFECKVTQVIPLGQEGGAGNLVVCQIQLARFHRSILDGEDRIDAQKLDSVARMGGDWYCRAFGEALFEVPKPTESTGIGIDTIPQSIRDSTVLTGNDLGRLGSAIRLPDEEDVLSCARSREMIELRARFTNDPESFDYHVHLLAAEKLKEGQIAHAWSILMQKLDFYIT